MDTIPNDIRCTGQPSMKRPKRGSETEKGEGAGGGDKAWNSKKQSSRSLFPSSSLSQVELRETYRKREDRNVEKKKKGKNKGAGRGEKAGNSKKQSSRSHKQRKRPKRCIEIGKDEEAGGGEKAGNSKKQSSRSLFPFPSHSQQDSESSKVIEEPKKTEGEVLLEEAVKDSQSSKLSEKEPEKTEGEDSQSSKVSEKDSKPTKGKKILEEALKAHAHKKNPAKK